MRIELALKEIFIRQGKAQHEMKELKDFERKITINTKVFFIVNSLCLKFNIEKSN
jgi:hypothetical protein